MASVIAKYFCHPIDTIKSKVQARASTLHTLSEYKVGHSLEIGMYVLTQQSRLGAMRAFVGSLEEWSYRPGGQSLPFRHI